jgi:hypothetical protein
LFKVFVLYNTQVPFYEMAILWRCEMLKEYAIMWIFDWLAEGLTMDEAIVSLYTDLEKPITKQGESKTAPKGRVQLAIGE